MSFLHTFVLLLDFLWPRSAMACAGLLAAFPPVLTWVNHVNNPVGTRGYGGGDGFVEHGAVVKHASEFVECPADTDLGSVKVTFPLFDKRAPCVLFDFILDIAARHPRLPCFQIRLPFADYDHLTKVLDKEITTAVNKTQKIWVAPLHGAVQFSVQKPKPRDFQEGQWCPQQCVQQLRYVRSTDCQERVPVYFVHSRQPQAWLEDLPGATTPTKYTTGTILALPLQSGPCLLVSAEPRTAIVLPPAPMVNQVKEKLLEFEHWFAQGGVASFTADLRSEFGGLDHKLRKNIFNSTMPTYARPEDGPARQVVYGVPPPPAPGLVRTQFLGVEHPLPALLRWAAHVRHQVDEAPQLRHMVTAMAYIIANTHGPQFPHRDFPPDFLPSGHIAWSAFSPVTMDLDVLDGTESTFVYGSTRCTPDPWHEVPMGMRRNTCGSFIVC